MKNLIQASAYDIDLRIKKIDFVEEIDEKELRKKDAKKWAEEAIVFLDFSEISGLIREIDGIVWGGGYPRFNLKELKKAEEDLNIQKSEFEENIQIVDDLANEKNVLVEYVRGWLEIKNDLKNMVLSIRSYDDAKKNYILEGCDDFDNEIKETKKEKFSRKEFEEGDEWKNERVAHFFEKVDMVFLIESKLEENFYVEIPCASKEFTHYLMGVPSECQVNAIKREGELFISFRGIATEEIFKKPIIAANDIEKITIRFILNENPLERKIKQNDRKFCENLEKTSFFSFKELKDDSEIFKKRIINSFLYSFRKDKKNINREDATKLLEEIEHQANALLNEKKESFFAKNFSNLKIFSRERGEWLSNQITVLLKKNSFLEKKSYQLELDIKKLEELKEKLDALLKRIYDRMKEIDEKDIQNKIENLYVINLRRERFIRTIIFHLIKISMKLSSIKAERANRNLEMANELWKEILNKINYFFKDLNYDILVDYEKSAIDHLNVVHRTLRKLSAWKRNESLLNKIFVFSPQNFFFRNEIKNQYIERLIVDIESVSSKMIYQGYQNPFFKGLSIERLFNEIYGICLRIIEDLDEMKIELQRLPQEYSLFDIGRIENAYRKNVGPLMTRGERIFYDPFIRNKCFDQNLKSGLMEFIDEEKELRRIIYSLINCVPFKEEITQLRDGDEKNGERAYELWEKIENSDVWAKEYSWKMLKKEKMAKEAFGMAASKIQEMAKAINASNENKLRRLFDEKKDFYLLFKTKMDSLPFAYPEDDVKKLEETEEETKSKDEEIANKIENLRNELSEFDAESLGKTGKRFLTSLARATEILENLKNYDEDLKKVREAALELKNMSHHVSQNLSLNESRSENKIFFIECAKRKSQIIEKLLELKEKKITCNIASDDLRKANSDFLDILFMIKDDIYGNVVSGAMTDNLSLKRRLLETSIRKTDDAKRKTSEFIFFFNRLMTKLENEFPLVLREIDGMKSNLKELKRLLLDDHNVIMGKLSDLLGTYATSPSLIYAIDYEKTFAEKKKKLVETVDALKKIFDFSKKMNLEKLNSDFEELKNLSSETSQKTKKIKDGLNDDDIKKVLEASEKSDKARRKILLFLNKKWKFADYDFFSEEFEKIERKANLKLDAILEKIEKEADKTKKEKIKNVLSFEISWINEKNAALNFSKRATFFLGNEEIKKGKNSLKDGFEKIDEISKKTIRLINLAEDDRSILEMKETGKQVVKIGEDIVAKIINYDDYLRSNQNQLPLFFRLSSAGYAIASGISDLNWFLVNRIENNDKLTRLRNNCSSSIFNMIMIRNSLANDINANIGTINNWIGAYTQSLNNIGRTISQSLNECSFINQNFLFSNEKKLEFQNAISNFANLKREFEEFENKLIFHDDIYSYQLLSHRFIDHLISGVDNKIKIVKNSIFKEFYGIDRPQEITDKLKKIKDGKRQIKNLKESVNSEIFKNLLDKKRRSIDALIDEMKNVDNLEKLKRELKHHELSRKIIAILKKKILLRDSTEEIFELAQLLWKKLNEWNADFNKDWESASINGEEFFKEIFDFLRAKGDENSIEELIEEEKDDMHLSFEEKIKNKMRVFDLIEIEEVEMKKNVADDLWKSIFKKMKFCDDELNSEILKNLFINLEKYEKSFLNLSEKISQRKEMFDSRIRFENLSEEIRIESVDEFARPFYRDEYFKNLGITREWHSRCVARINSFFSDANYLKESRSYLISNMNADLKLQLRIFSDALYAYISQLSSCINSIRNNPINAASIFNQYDPIFVNYEGNLSQMCNNLNINDFILSDEYGMTIDEISKIDEIRKNFSVFSDVSDKLSSYYNFLLQNNLFNLAQNGRIRIDLEKEKMKNFFETLPDDALNFGAEKEISVENEKISNEITLNSMILLEQALEKIQDNVKMREIDDIEKAENRCENEIKELTNPFKQNVGVAGMTE